MKTHLFLDWAKIHVKAKKIPYPHARVALFAPFKLAKKWITPDEPHAIYVLPEKRAVKSMVVAAQEILAGHTDAKIAIVSPRKKWVQAAKNLQQQYPNAQILLKKRLRKSVRQFLKNLQMLPENASANSVNIPQIANTVQAAVQHVLSPEPPPTSSQSSDFPQKNRRKNPADWAKLLFGQSKFDPKTVVAYWQKRCVQHAFLPNKNILQLNRKNNVLSKIKPRN